MAGKKTRELAREERRQKIAKLLLQNKNYVDIAKEVECSTGTVYNDVKQITAEWRKEYAATNEQRIAAEHQRLLEIDEEARIEWEKSKDRKRTKVKRIPMSGGKFKEEVEVISLLPDRNFLETRRSISQDIRKLFGLDKPQKHALTNPEGDKEYQYKDVVSELTKINADKRKEIIRLLESNDTAGKKPESGAA